MPKRDDIHNTAEASGIDPEILARAEQAVAALGDDFAQTIRSELIDMKRLIDRLADGTGDYSGLFERAHDMAGMGGSFGFPLISRIGRSLCDIIETRTKAPTHDDIAIFRAHTDAGRKLIDGTVNGAEEAESMLKSLGPADSA